MKNPIIVNLQTWEYEHACNIGIRRYTANWSKKDAPHYKKERMEDDRTAVVAAAICELAVAKYTNRYWHAHVWHASEHDRFRDLPDVGRNIEVRRIRTGAHVAVRKHQLGRGLVLWAARPEPPEFRQVELFGWMRDDEAWEVGRPSEYDPEKTRVVDVALLHGYDPT
jgi:hypothetical protein